MMRHRAARIVKLAVLGIIAFVVFGVVVFLLWNWLMPTLFGLHPITFWQAWGLLALSWLFFGGMRGPGGPGRGRRWRRRMMERWAQMTPEEREKFRQGLGGECGPLRPAATEPKA
jgi:hypothetical protein